MLLFVAIIPSAVAVHNEGLFELDGNPQSSATPGEDWEQIFNGTSSAVATEFMNDKYDGAAGDGANDNVFTGGSTKDDLDVSGWLCKTGGAVDKNDIEHAFAAAYVQSSGANAGDTFVYFGADKYSTSGDAQIGFWFFQSPIGCSPGADASTPFSGQHTVGDILVLSDFTNGGNVSNIRVFKWDPANADTNGTLDFLDAFGDCALTVGDDDACAKVNGADGLAAVWPYTPKANLGPPGAYPKGAFYEGGVNLSDLLGTQNVPCFGAFLAETRQSQSVDSVLEDFALGSLNTCPDLRLAKTPDSGAHFVGDQFDWTLNVSNAGAGASNVVVTDTIPASLEIVGTPTFDVDPLSAGGTGNCGVAGQVVTCNIGSLGADDGNTTAPEADNARVTIRVKALAAAVAGTTAACATVNNTGSVTADREPTSAQGDNSDSGAVSVCRLGVSKTASPSFTRTFNWNIAKSASPGSLTMYRGDSGDVQWTVNVTPNGSTDSAWKVSGNISVSSPAGAPNNRTVNVLDSYEGTAVPAANISCTVSGGDTGAVSNPYADFDAGESLSCTWFLNLSGPTTGTNTATARLTNVSSGSTDFTGTAAVSSFGDPTTKVNETVNVTDTQKPGALGSATAPNGAQFQYTKTYACDADAGTKNNTATITETGQTAQASASVTCLALSVSKTVNPSFTRTFNWNIAKSASPNALSLYRGDSGDVQWTVNVTPNGSTDSAWKVSGNITVAAPAGAPNNRTVNVTDSYQGTAVPAANISCTVSGGDTGAVSNPYTDLDAGESLACTWFLDLSGPTTGTNTATAQLTNVPSGTTNFTGQAVLASFGNPTTKVNETVNVTDTQKPGALGSATAPNGAQFQYTKTYACDADAGTKNNTATITETGQTANASASITCLALTVTKTAAPSFTRTFAWDVQKTATGSDGSLTLAVGETFLQPYSVTYSVTGHTDSAWKVSGQIEVTAPAGAPNNRSVTVLDSYGATPVPAANISCTVSGGDTGAVSNPYTDLDAGEKLTCSWFLDLSGPTTALNTATARLANVPSGTTDFTGTFNLASFGSPTTLVDEQITASDNVPLSEICTGANTPLPGCTAPSDAGYPPSATVTVAQAPKTFTYTRIIGPYTAAQCGERDVDNTASLVTNDSATPDSSSAHIDVTVTCPQVGCTLTQGYWKTHSIIGPAPFDLGWNNVPANPYAPDDGDGIDENHLETFFLSGQSWYDVFWTAPKGNVYYNLAHQYMAAVLNVLNGADPSAVTATLDQALALLQLYTPVNIAELKGKNGNELRARFISLAGTLASYNEGAIGPGHCDEDRTSATG